MNIAVIHLSDIHIDKTENKNVIFSRIDKLLNVVISTAEGINKIFVVISGDIAKTGDPEEYKVAKSFITRITDYLNKRDYKPKIIIVPGNHDCTFRDNNQVRDTVINNLEKDNVELQDSSICTTCTNIQNAFFAFLKEITPGVDVKDNLFYKYCFDDGKVQFNCFNTAWVSKLKETQGDIFFPLTYASFLQNKDANYIFSIFHHPYHWFNHGNISKFKELIERNSDAVVTGHSHIQGYAEQKRLFGEFNQYVEGGVLQEGKKSEFNLLLYDFQEHRRKIVTFEWKGDNYVTKAQDEWATYTRSSNLLSNKFVNASSFSEELDDPGINLSHKIIKKLRLDDVFIYPDLKILSIDNKQGTAEDILKGHKLFEFVLTNKKTIIVGEDKSGRTSLAKTLYKEFLRKNIVPVMFDGRSIQAEKPKFLKMLTDSFISQYSSILLSDYTNLDVKNKAFIIDDFNKLHLNQTHKGEFLLLVASLFEYVILISDDSFKFEEIVDAGSGVKYPSQFKTLEIKPFGYLLRERLIGKWVSLGAHETDYNDLIPRIERIERAVNTLLKKNLIPPYPLYILIVLQSLEAHILRPNTQLGAYGYYYELLITKSLSEAGTKPSLDTKYNYLAEAAYYLYSNNVSEFTEEILDELETIYDDNYSFKIETQNLIRDLESVNIFQKTASGWKFRYRYIYYYFIAKYIKDNASDEQAKESLQTLTSQMLQDILNEENYNILIFLVYLTKDTGLIRKLLNFSKDIYKEISPMDFNKDFKFIQEIACEEPKICIDKKPIKDSREEQLQIMDEIEEQGESDLSSREEKLLKITTAFKVLEMLGQIVRNFAGSLKTKIKTELTEECYSLGLRVLHFMAIVIGESYDDFRKKIAAGYLDKDKVADEKEINRACFMLVEVITLGIIKKISLVVGTDDLRPIYKQILHKDGTRGTQFIDLSLRLDLFGHPPVPELVDFAEEIKSDLFLTTLLRLLVVYYLSLFFVKHDERQKICSKLGITMKDDVFLQQDLKKFSN